MPDKFIEESYGRDLHRELKRKSKFPSKSKSLVEPCLN